ncbi:Odorant receptor 258 [Nylanderia fulva]|uniref:Odorant receptor n=1 Tax=Nylanderia fulva TaxID=613905 RepID=A0A6G1LPI0_9HYME|nr:odorant receptor 63a-like [Nylanderia fulva]KAF3054506.1 Odorant receptor 258 [Nylanderia fulva]
MTYSKRVSTSIKLTSNTDYSLQLARWFLLPIGIWPRMNTATKFEKFSSCVHILICIFLIAIVAVPCFLYVSLEEKDIEIKLSTIGPLSHWIMGLINYCLLLSRKNNIRECMRHMEMDWRLIQKFEDRQVMLQQAKFGRFVAGICAIFMQSGVFLFFISKSLTTTIVIIGNETMSMHLLAWPIYSKFIDTRFSPANEIMQIIEMLSTFIVNSVTVGACSLDAIFAMHACAQLSVLFSWLNKLIVDKNNNNDCAKQRLGIIVKHHLRVLSFISRMESIMRNICLVELLGCTMNMCLLSYYLITWWNKIDANSLISYTIVYISMSFNIFIFCYIGEILTQQCKKVGETAYMIDWYRLPHRTALGLILIISRSSAAIKITAGKFIQLSIATYSDVMKTSFVYLNMLRTVTV